MTDSNSGFREEKRVVRISFLDDRSRRAREQMAVDGDLLNRMGQGWGGLLRIYRFLGPSVTVGRTFGGDLPPSWLELNPDMGVRPTGGGAVLHQDDLCFSFFLYPRASFTPKLFYRRFHGWVKRFLETLSVEASWSEECIPDRQTAHGVCFERPVSGDLLSGARKVMGGALRISGLNRLSQGSLAIPGYPGDELRESFRKWYRQDGSRMLREELCCGFSTGTVAKDPVSEGRMSCYG
ncbi:MAG: lipoyl protein ligase domain-containing protein [Leptospirales bacterium]